jgi:hypothetical protein
MSMTIISAKTRKAQLIALSLASAVICVPSMAEAKCGFAHPKDCAPHPHIKINPPPIIKQIIEEPIRIIQNPKRIITDPIDNAKKALKGVKQTTEDIITIVTLGNGDVEKTIKKADGDFEKIINKASGDVEKTVTKASGDILTAVKKVGGDTITSAKKVSGDVVTTVRKVGGDVEVTIKNAGGDAIAIVKKAGGDVVATYHKAGSAVVTNVQKGWRDVSKGAQGVFRELTDAEKALARFTSDQIKGDIAGLSAAEKRLREGKIVDAVWGLASEPLKRGEQNAGKAVQESAVLNAAAQGAATFYGGPAGAAAYAAWYTYRQTGDADMALRVGLITAATSVVGGQTGQMPTATVSDVVKKAAVRGVVGGLTVAAAGGDLEDVKRGFLDAGAKVLVQDGYTQIAGQPMDDATYQRAAYCLDQKNLSCLPNPQQYVRDQVGALLDKAGNKIDPDGIIREVFGLVVHDEFGFPKLGIPTLTQPMPASETKHRLLDELVYRAPAVPIIDVEREQASAMSSLSKIVDVKTVTLAGGALTLSWSWAEGQIEPSGFPDIVLTNVGPSTPLYESVKTVAVDAAQQLTSALPPAALLKPQPTSFICSLHNETRTIEVSFGDGQHDCSVSDVTATYEDPGAFFGYVKDQRNLCVALAANLVSETQKAGFSCLAK